MKHLNVSILGAEDIGFDPFDYQARYFAKSLKSPQRQPEPVLKSARYINTSSAYNEMECF